MVQKVIPVSPLWAVRRGLASAAGAKEDASEDDEPEPVVIKELTNAVAVHIITLPFEVGRGTRMPTFPLRAWCGGGGSAALLVSFYVAGRKMCTDSVGFCGNA